MIAALPRPTSRGFGLAIGITAGVAGGAAVALANPMYALLGLLAAGLVVAACALPVGRFWLLAGVITLLPFAAAPRLGIQPTLLDGALALVLGVALLGFLTRAQPPVGTPLDLPIVIYLALCGVSFVFGAA